MELSRNAESVGFGQTFNVVDRWSILVNEDSGSLVMPMKMTALKQRVYQEWDDLHFFEDAVAQPEKFKAEVRRQFGDLRFKATWKKALCYFRALNLQHGYLDSYELLLKYLNFQPSDELYAYRHQIFDAFLALPDALELIRTGLEQLFSSDFTPTEREKASGFFELVEEQSGRRGLDGQPNELVRRFTGAAGAAAR